MPESELDLCLCGLGPVHNVFLNGALQRRKTLRGMVKVRNGIMQSRGGQVRKQLLKSPERFRGFEGLLARLDRIIALRLLNKEIRAPAIAFWIQNIRTTVPRGDEGECAAKEIRFASEFSREMRGDPLDIFHQARRVLKNFLIDALQNIANARADLFKRYTIGIIDVAAAVRRRFDKFTINLKLARYGAGLRD